MTLLPHMAARIFGAPLLIHRPKLEVILAVLGPRIGLSEGGTPIPSPSTRSPPASDAGIAILPVYGTLVRRTVGLEAASGLTSYQDIAAQLDAAIADTSVAAIVLDIDSPGGESGGVFDLADRVRAATQVKPVWALANDMAYSAAYALGSAASRFFVTRTGGVGSIGVIAMHADQSVRDAKDGVRYTTVFAGARKNDLNPHEPISDEAHAFLKSEVDRIYSLFVDTVASHRGLTSDAVRATEAGVFFGQDAVAAGLADAVGTFDDVLAELIAALSPPPALAAAALGHLHQPRLEHFMNEPGTTADPGVGADPDRADGANPPMTIDDAQEIAELCALAGCPERIAGFLAVRTSAAAVRGHLLATRATGQEINSLITPSAATSATQSLNDNPLVLAARARAGQEK
ncbi:S49 family peptidase [Stenotrophomonas sp. CW117]|uniref:S49 family peptidase n=1 Tax=Stenotrophomonas TaxID=40323 RepID=UPI0007037299|nr:MULTISPECIES: S49 family peptidase [Stenotrophomonas]KRG85651.1 serine protease ClpP [Stenotrophomonas acidaminiphila]QOF97336.1 S49 family peptidase [Stenotrophomonas sp. CW117]